ncbi:MAG: hypothetical protein JNL79_12940 [Myxococcales bacterium]|nr:hypothetical protein [Myxococcales bacterium]
MLTKLSAIPDLHARALALGERLATDPAALAELDALVRRAMNGGGPERDVVLALVHLRVTRDDLPIGAWRAEADRRSLVAASLVLRTDGAYRNLRPRGKLSEPTAASSNLVTLAWKAAPRDLYTRQGQLIRNAPLRERLLRDPRPEVVAALLEIDTTTVADALRVAARRPSSPALARAVAASRWLGQLPVREALVRNPFTETWLSLVLLPTVRRVILLAAPIDPELVRAVRSLEA